MAEEVTVFRAWGSAISYRVELALTLKGVEFQRVEEDISNKSPELLKYNPVHKKIPVLVHGGKPIPESHVILEYIDETWRQTPLLPAEPYERARARFWTKYIDDKCLMTPWRACWTEGEQQRELISETGECLRTLETALQGRKFFGGDAIGIVDVAASFVAYWIGVSQEAAGICFIDEEKLPVLCRWIDAFLSCDVVKKTLPPREKLLALYQGRKEALRLACKNTPK